MAKIRATFRQMSDARKTVQKLKEIGYKDAHLDMMDTYLEEYSEEIKSPGTENALNVSALVMNSSGFSRGTGKAFLSSLDPMASGFCVHEEMFCIGARLFVSPEENKIDEVKRIISEYGGVVD